MKNKCTIISISNQKGGVDKTTTALNLVLDIRTIHQAKHFCLKTCYNDIGDKKMKIFNPTSKDVTFEDFKSNTCHTLKSMGDIHFLVEVLSNREIDELYNCKEYLKCIYLLAMVDYLSRKNEIPLVEDYNEYRKMKSEYIVYPSSVIAEASVMKSEVPKKTAYENSIDEFKRVNIVESEIYNVA